MTVSHHNYSLIRTSKRIVNAEERGKAKLDGRTYRENIRKVIGVLSGKRKRIASGLKRQMREAAKKQGFERAATLRDQIQNLENIFAHRKTLDLRFPMRSHAALTRAWPAIEQELLTLFGIDRKISRVEGYDISNISGTSATGSMVAFMRGVPKKSDYRKFKIKTVAGANDVAMHREVLRRRLGHPEWPYPDLIIMDGGKPQLNAAATALSSEIQDSIFQIPLVVALAKREEELYIEERQQPVRLDSLSRDTMHFFQQVRDESHRFAKKYHHKLRELSYRSS